MKHISEIINEIFMNHAIISNNGKLTAKHYSVEDFKTAYKKYLDQNNLKGNRTRKRELVKYRQCFMWFGRKKSIVTLKEIGLICGNYDHTTVINNVKRFQDLLDTEPAEANKLIKEIEKYFLT